MVHLEWWSVEHWSSEGAKGKLNNPVCPLLAAEPSCPASQTDNGSQLGRLRATALTSAFVLAQLWKLTQSIRLSQSPGYQAPQNNGWLNRTMVAGRVGGRKSGRVAGCFVREVPFCFVFSNGDGLTMRGTHFKWALGGTFGKSQSISTQMFSLYSSPVPEGFILTQFFNPLHK